MKNKTLYIIVGILVVIGLYFAGRALFEPKIPSILTQEDIILVEERLDMAKNQLDVALEEEDDRKIFDAYMAIGSQYKLLSKYYKSVNAYDSAQLYNAEGLPHAFTGIYGVASAAERWNKALWALDEAISLDDQNSDYWLWKLEIMEQKTKATTDEINAEYKRAVETLLSPERVVLVYAGFLERIGKVGEAKMTLGALLASGYNVSFVSAELDRLTALTDE
jgi:tetratricopeptide (TPR) repeat protein